MAKPKIAKRPAPAALSVLAAPVKVAIGLPVAPDGEAAPVPVATGLTRVPLADGYGRADAPAEVWTGATSEAPAALPDTGATTERPVELPETGATIDPLETGATKAPLVTDLEPEAVDALVTTGATAALDNPETGATTALLCQG